MSGWSQGNFFNDFAESLVDHGFTVTPTRGKNAFLKNWQNPKPTDRQWLGRMLNASRYAGCNIGIVCGRVVAIDIDADDRAEVAKIETLLESTAGGTPFQRVGRAPRTLHLYRPAQDEIIASTDFACIQVLSGGQAIRRLRQPPRHRQNLPMDRAIACHGEDRGIADHNRGVCAGIRRGSLCDPG
ncbi:MAG: bifunctional DNA primase/polymerase [Xanthobacteraceae bacterium]|jgi:hypothetical protein